MSPGQNPWVLGSHIRFRMIAGECVVVDQNASTVAVLNEVAGRTLELLHDGRSRAEVATRIATEYRVPKARSQEDLDIFLGQLSDQGWLTEQS